MSLLPERKGEAEVMVVGDVAAKVGVRAEVEVEVQLQIVIQLHQTREWEFHSSQQYMIYRHRQDQGHQMQERGGHTHTHRLHRQSVEGSMQGRECQIFRESTVGDRGGRSTVGVVGLGAG